MPPGRGAPCPGTGSATRCPALTRPQVGLPWRGAGRAALDEDCLYLAVHTPVVEEGEGPLPVLVWVTGGAFIIGGGSWYGPDYWMIHKVVLVTVNYRVGPLGFLTLGVEEAPGNAGLWDQAAALAWVGANIAGFGGDPGRVTLAGESAGSFSAFYHLAAPASRGLFHRIIGQSGVGGLAPGYHQWSPQVGWRVRRSGCDVQEGLRLGLEASLLLGCPQLGSQERLACLRNVSAWELTMVDFEAGILSMPVEDAAWSPDPFFPGPPGELLESGQFDTSVDVLLGSNSGEGLLITQLLYSLPSLLPLVMASWDAWRYPVSGQDSFS